MEDSAGVRIVEAAWNQVPLLDSVAGPPRHEMGAPGDGVELFDVRDARLLEDGRIAVAHASAGEVLVWDTVSGRSERFGRRGEGPEELGRLASVHDEGRGRIGAFDVGRSRYLVFDTAGAVVASTSFTDLGIDPPQHLVRADDGRVYVVRTAGGLGDLQGDGVARAELPVLALAGAGADTVIRIAGQEVFVSRGAMGLSVFGPTTSVVPARDGLWIGDTAVPEVRRVDGNGTVLTVVRWTGGPDRRLGEARAARALEPILSAVPEGQRERARESALESLPLPDSVPAFQHLVAGRDGTVWVGAWLGPGLPQLPGPEDARQWLLVGADGRPLGRVVTPPGFALHDAGPDWVLGVQTGDLGVETVRLYAFAGPG